VKGSLEHSDQMVVVRPSGVGEFCFSNQEFKFGDQFFSGLLSLSKVFELVSALLTSSSCLKSSCTWSIKA